MSKHIKPKSNRASSRGLPLHELVPRGTNGDQYPAMDLTQTSNGKLLVAMYGSHIRYCYPAKKWFVYGGTCWREDTSGVMGRAAKRAVERLRELAARAGDEQAQRQLLQWARQSQSVAEQEAMLKQARSEPGISIQPDEFDHDPWLLGLLNGTLDLRTRTFRPSRAEDYITKLCGVSYDPNAACPQWERFLRRILPSDAVRWHFQKLLGVSLTGDTSDQGFYILWGAGANGKTTAVQAYRRVLGDYALDTPTATLLSRAKDGGIPNDLARLRGARFVYAAEPDVTKKLAEELLKRITGGDPITARFLFGEFFTYWPEFKLFLLANHKPQIAAQDHGTWRRPQLIPFTETIPPNERDKHFLEKYLIPEGSGILNWGLDGLDGWVREGLEPPDEIREATEQYRKECDELGEFFDECVEPDPIGQVSKRDLYDRFEWFLGGRPPLSIIEFGRLVKQRGVQDGSTGIARVWKGIRLRAMTG